MQSYGFRRIRMNGIAFKLLTGQQDDRALYQSNEQFSGSVKRSTLFYFVFLEKGVQAPQSIDNLQQCFDKDSAVCHGVFVFAEAPLPSPDDLFKECKANLQPGTNPVTYPRLAWRGGTASYLVIELSAALAVSTTKQLPFGRWIIEVGQNSSIVQAAGDQIVIEKATGTSGNSLKVIVITDSIPKQSGSLPELITVPLSGQHTGGLLFDWNWRYWELGNQFGGELRMFYGNDQTQAAVIRYPLFEPPRAPGPVYKSDLAFKVTAHPLAQLQGARTRLAFAPNTPQQFNALNAVLMRTPTGAEVTLKALASGDTINGAGFGFAKTAVQAGATDYYLTPVGNFSVQKVLEKPTVQIMTGIVGSEFVLVETGDILMFENDHAAFAKNFKPDSTAQLSLDPDFTTSWVKVFKSIPKTAADDQIITTSYCAQPSNATYFARHEKQSLDDFSAAIGISLSQLAKLAPEQNPLFPFLPYGGVFYHNDDIKINPDVEAATVSAFEKHVVEPLRRTLLEPTFDPVYGPIFFDAANNLAFQGGCARTPMGFIAGLNKSGAGGKPPAGSWNKLMLAQSPQDSSQILQLTANENGVVNPRFSNSVLRENLFMVVTDPTLLWPQQEHPGNNIKLGDFTFQVNIGTYDAATDKDQPHALAVFKFIPEVKFTDLAGDTTRWTSFFGKGDDAVKVQTQIARYIESARQGDPKLYAAFNSIVDDPNWTGLLIFNCPLNYKSLPPDIQILLGGIKGTLRGHHFGITINRIKDETTGAMSIQNSSLFAVIDYNEKFVSPQARPDFQVLLLNIEYANSKLVVFNSRIAFSLNQLFSNTAVLTQAPAGDYPKTGTFVIDGVYTLHEDGTGSLVFATDNLRVFTIKSAADKLRVLETQSVTNVALVPVESRNQPDGSVKAIAALRLDGTLAFKKDIAGDVFSYGEIQKDNTVKGLVITGYAFNMTTDIPANEGPAQLATITTDLSGIKVDQAYSIARTNSLEKTFPGKIDSLDYIAGGMSTAQAGAWQIQCKDMKDIAPQYMLHFKVPMGSLGGLVSSTANIISDLYIGWISGGKDDTDDQVGAVLVLPAFIASADGFQIQGIASSTFESVYLERQKFKSSTSSDTIYAYDLRFQHYASSLLGIPLIYNNAPKDLGIFGSPTDSGGDNAMWFVGKTMDPNWKKGPQPILVLSLEPAIFIGRAFAIETDPANPKVIDDAIRKLSVYEEQTVSEYMTTIYAESGKYDSAAGMTFALKFDFTAIALSLLFHDNDFYGAKVKVKIDAEKKKKKEEEKEDEKEKEDDKKKAGNKLKGFEFSIIYRKINEHLGVWSATIFVNIGKIQIGTAALSLPDFAISIWTNGDWRFSVGWPIEDHPIKIEFQAGPVPIIGKLGFYLAKLRSEDSPSKLLIPGDPLKYPPNFALIWSFGLGIAAGVGKEFQSGPLSASASLCLALTVEGFLASYLGDFSADGVDYYWWCISLALTGEVSGKVDFKIIGASLSITLTLKLALALETRHSTVLVLTFEAKVKASIKIIFVTISFSFSAKLTLLDTSFGSGPNASLDGPNPKELALFKAPGRLAPTANECFTARAAEPAVVIPLYFLLQSTAISADGSTWTPQAVASLIVVNQDTSSPFFKLANGLIIWLLGAFGGETGSFREKLTKVEEALKKDLFNDQVENCLSSRFIFTISALTGTPENPPPVAVIPVHPALGLLYKGNTVCFGTPKVSANYSDLVQAYFDQEDQALQASALSNDSVASLLFNEYFVMFAKQLVADLQQTAADTLAAALTQAVCTNVAGFVTRFLMGGMRLPKPDNPAELAPIYVLTSQQFAIDEKVLEAELVSVDKLPDWIGLAGKVKAGLLSSQIYKIAPKSHPWIVQATPPITPVPARFPMNANLTWTDLDNKEHTIFNYADSIHLAIENWRSNPVNTGKPGPWLKLEQVSGSTPEDTKSKPYSAATGLILPLTLTTIPDPEGKAGDVLKDIYSLVGTDEVHRAYLQALLEDSCITINSLQLLVNTSQGKYTSVKLPKVLVRTNLSTSTVPGGVNAAAVCTGNCKSDAPADPHCANYAKPAAGGEELLKFLRIVWECSVVHSGGFYLQVEGLTADQFKTGQAALQLLVQTGNQSSVIQAESYQNTLVGAAPEKDSAVLANLNSDSGNTPVVTYTASYPGGSTGWSIEWQNPPLAVDVQGAAGDVLLGLYQMVSYRVTAIDGVKIANMSWSRPITALHDDADGNSKWNYQKSFPTAPLLGKDQNTYAAVGKKIDVAISIEDIFGNSIPPVPQSLTVVYNDDIMGLANWADTQTNYNMTEAARAGKTQLTVSISYGSLPFSLGDFKDIAALVNKIKKQADAVSVFVWGQFSAQTQTIFNNPDSTPDELQVTLINGLNIIISGSLIYEKARFNAVVLRAQTIALIKENPQGNLLLFLNRLLLEDAYPDLIRAQIADNSGKDALQRTLDDYSKINNQLHDPHLTAAVNTGALLAPDTPNEGAAPQGALTGDALVKCLQDYVNSITVWLTWLVAGKPQPPVNVPQPVDLQFELDKKYPLNWDGDLRELRVDLLLRRSGVDKDIALKAPQVQHVASPVTPMQNKSSEADPTGLSTFAVNFEKAYYRFDGKDDGVIKVATGVNSDLKSSRLGAQSLWLARWGATSGITVQILNDDKNKPVYYATPPLSTQLITRKVKDLKDYRTTPPTLGIEQIFSAIDIDLLATSFLSSVETIFSPQIAPEAADRSVQADIYNPYVENKTKLAKSISDKLAFIYQGMEDSQTQGKSDPISAKETLRQALLYTLENDYGISTLIQMAARIGLHGNIEPGSASPPNLFGNITPLKNPIAGNENKPLPYDFSSAKLPLKQGNAWLNFLLSVQDPGAQKALQLPLDYQMGFIEHNIDPAATRCGYTPSEWISFVLQQNEKSLPQGEQNTLTAPMGNPRIPIPLRSYPPLPRLISASASPAIDPKDIMKISDALCWTYELTVARPTVAQDTLNLIVTFNEPPESEVVTGKAVMRKQADLRAGDLFDALARYSYEYPYLKPDIQAIARGGTPQSNQALQDFRDLVNEVATAWPSWKQPQCRLKKIMQTTIEVWNYTIDQEEDNTLSCTASWNHNTNSGDLPPWPYIAGYQYPPVQKSNANSKTWVYTLISPADKPAQWQLTWKNFYVLDYQSARASAFIERNRNLGGNTGEKTNDIFVYRTETVRMPSCAIPLIKVPRTLSLDSGSSLKGAVQSMLETMHTIPKDSISFGVSKGNLKLEGPIFYSFRLLNNKGSSVRSFLPLYLMQNNIAPGKDAEAAGQVTRNMNAWRKETNPKIDQSFISFRHTIFATRIVQDEEQLPLVQFQDLCINIPENMPNWWSDED